MKIRKNNKIYESYYMEILTALVIKEKRYSHLILTL